eukprot:ANDGO_06519.mRNA.1 putative endoplasmic reticulum-Golgi intermediate compartment protein 3
MQIGGGKSPFASFAGLGTRLKTLDAYPKLIEDFRVKTVSGAAISIISIAVIVILVISEFMYYLSSERVDHLTVDASRGLQLPINFDITFPRMGCDLITVGAFDMSGEHYSPSAVEHDIEKHDLDTEMRSTGESRKMELMEDSKIKEALEKARQPRPEGYCGSCFGAESETMACCNTCDDVKTAYRAKGWAFIPSEQVEQCVRDALERKMKRSRERGCNIKGTMKVNRVAGNLHFTPSSAFQNMFQDNNEFLPFELADFNMTHTINSLSFGKQFSGQINPLDRTAANVEKGVAQFQYFVKVVPTRVDSRWSSFETNQYSVTEHVRQVDVPKDAHFNPGVFFIYDISPIRVNISQRSKTFASFLTSVCAIVGGIFTFAALIDRAVYHGINTITKKIELGKSS